VDEDDLVKFKAFVAGVVISYYGRKIRWAERRAWLPEQIKRRSSRMSNRPPFNALRCPVSYMAKALKISKSTSSHYKTLAIEAGYIHRSHQFRGLNVEPQFAHLAIKANEKHGMRIRNKSGQVSIQLPDKLHSNIVLKRKRFRP